MLRPARLCTVLAPALALVGLAACASNEPRLDPESPAYLVRHGEFDEALSRARKAYQENPDDERALKVYVIAAAINNMHRGRELTFSDRDEEAMDYFWRAKSLAPNAPEVDHWIQKTNEKIAERRLDEATDALVKSELELALELYRDALSHSPGNVLAMRGEAEALIRINYRAGRGEAYYKEGMRALKRSWLNGAARDFASARKFDGDYPRVDERITEVDQERALERINVAQNFESQGLYAAARNEYRIAQILDPGVEGALEGYRRMDRESTVADFLREADMQRRKGNLLEAELLVERARGLTELQHDFIDLAEADVRGAQYEILYREAVENERDGFYAESLAMHEQLLEIAGYYEDSRARRDTMRELVDKAEELYEKTTAAESEEAALPFLREIMVFYPEFRDVADRVERAEAEEAAAAAAAAEEAAKEGTAEPE